MRASLFSLFLFGCAQIDPAPVAPVQPVPTEAPITVAPSAKLRASSLRLLPAEPFPLYSTKIMSAALEDTLHIVLYDSTKQQELHFTYNQNGEISLPLHPLPLKFGGQLTACGKELLMVAVIDASNQPYLVSLSAKGEVQWKAQIPQRDPYTTYKILCTSQGATLAWRSPDRDKLSLYPVQKEALGPEQVVSFSEKFYEVSAAANQKEILISRQVKRQKIELTRVTKDNTETISLPSERPLDAALLGSAQGQYVLLWASPETDEVGLQQFTQPPKALSEDTKIPINVKALHPEERLQWYPSGLWLSEAGYAVFSVQATWIDGWVTVGEYSNGKARMEPAHHSQSYLYLYDLERGVYYEPIKTSLANLITAGWLGDQFYTVTYDRGVQFSLYELQY